MSRTALPTDGAPRAVPRSADRRAALALSLVDGVGPIGYRASAALHDGADRAFGRVVGEARSRALAAADAALAAAARVAATLRLIGDDDYPVALLELNDAPPALWLLGDASLLGPALARVALVGTRTASAYGLRTSAALATALAAAGAVVVSGMARGIDGAAHAAALDGAGATVAVLGCGVDVAYPRTHTALHRRIVAHGLVLSEQLPGSAPTPGAFPRRNRLIAALSRATIVVEAGVRSGALITAGVALELAREVGAVPGPIESPESAGANALLRDGAAVIADPSDALSLAGVAVTTPARGRAPILPTTLDADARTVWTALGAAGLDVDALAAAVPLPVDRCLAAITTLELSGHLDVTPAGTLRRR